MTEEDTRPLDLPPVDEGEVEDKDNGNDYDDRKGFEKVASETTKVKDPTSSIGCYGCQLAIQIHFPRSPLSCLLDSHITSHTWRQCYH